MNENTTFSLTRFVLSVSFDCVCGTVYFPAFDASILSKIPTLYVGRAMAFLNTVGLVLGILSPIVVINGLYSVDHELPYVFGVVFSCMSTAVQRGRSTQQVSPR
jgi:hypothetical protein